MRRLWAYIITAFTALVLVGTTFASVFLNATSNFEYENGKEIVFRISDEEGLNEEEFENGNAVNEMAKEMERRLQLQGISKYTVATEGKDTVKVAFSGSDDQVEKVKLLLTFNGSFALTTSNDDVVLGEEFLTSKKAYLTEKEGLPTVVIPVDNENPTFKNVIQAVLDQQKEYDDDRTEMGDSEEAEEKIAYLYLWQDYVEGDSYTQTLPQIDGKDNPEYDPEVAEKIIMPFSAKNLYFNGEEDKLSSSLMLDANEDEVVTVQEVSQAYSNARFYVNLLNAGTLDYSVEYMYEKEVGPIYENLIGLGETDYLKWSATLVSTLIAILVTSALLATFYRLGSLSSITTTILSVFAGVGFIVLFGVEFNTAAIIGLIITAIGSLVSSIIYLNKLKEEAYKGRSLKKANSEAAKKALLPIVDVNVVVIVIGACAYLFGGVLFRAFAAATVLGGVASLILNLTLLRGMMWLATNTTSLTGKYSVFGIEEDKVPNIIAEEKQTYYGPYADKDFTKKKKPLGILAILLFVASLAGGITFGVLNNGNIYNDGGVRVANSQIYIETTAKNTSISETYLTNTFEEVRVHSENTDESRSEAVALSTYISEIEQYTNTVVDKEGETKYTYFVVTLNKPLSATTYAYVETEDSDLIYNTLSLIIQERDSKVSVDLKEVRYVEQDQPNITPIAISTGVAILVLGLYFVLRYKLSRGLSATAIATLTGAVTLGFFVLTRIVVPTYISVALPLVVAFAFILSTLIMNREREMILDDKTRDNSPAHRNEIMIRANSIAFTSVIISTVLAVYLGINFFGFGPQATSPLFLAAIVGILLAALFASSLFGPTAQLLYGWFYRVEQPNKPRKPRKTKKVTRNKSAEPEEATFIGIND